MSIQEPGAITEILDAVGRGDAEAQEKLWSAVHDELHRLAHQQMAQEARHCTLDTTVLVNETYLRLVGTTPLEWHSRGHFFRAAARAMRCICIEQARRRARLKRGGGRELKELAIARPGGDNGLDSGEDQIDLMAVDQALGKLEKVDSRRAEVVMLRFFAGLTVDETASAIGVSPRTVDMDWRFARAWLHREMSAGA